MRGSRAAIRAFRRNEIKSDIEVAVPASVHTSEVLSFLRIRNRDLVSGSIADIPVIEIGQGRKRAELYI
jgi:hypothetical protein